MHSGHVEHPSPEPVMPTAPPVTTIADCVKTMRLAKRRSAFVAPTIFVVTGRAYVSARFLKWRRAMNYATIPL